MGVNAPARTVVFDTLRKFDGKEFRQLLSGEYTQMAGRAGRRGLDKIGTVIVICRDELPEESDLKRVIVGSATRLESQFRLTYIMILHLLRVEELKVEDMLKRSFAEFHAQKKLPEMQQLLKRKLDQPRKAIECIKGEPTIEEYYDLYSEAETYNNQISEAILQSPSAQQFLNTGRVVIVKSESAQDHLLGVVVKTPSPNNKTYIVFVIKPDMPSIMQSASSGTKQINSLLTSLINSAAFANYNNFTLPVATYDTVYGLFQCRGDLSNDQCSRCVARAVTQLGTLCYASCGGALQLDGCFVKYDNATFVGVEDKTVVTKKCGPSVGLTSDALTRRDAVLAYLQTSDGTYKTFRTSAYGDFQGVAQCTGDLSPTECQDCLSGAIQRLKTDCGPSPWAEMYLAKCYASYSQSGSHSRPNNNDDSNHNDDEIEKTLAILIGLIAGVALIIVFLSFLSKVCEKHKGGK